LKLKQEFEYGTVKPVLRGDLLGQGKRGLIRQIEVHSYEIFNFRTRKTWPFNTGECLIEVTTLAGLTVTLW